MSNIKKLRRIFTRREQWQLSGLLLAIIAMSFLQALGIASVLPFISLIMEPNLIYENQWLHLAFTTLNFGSEQLFIVFTGVTMFVLIIISNIVSAIATWLKIRFSLMLEHRLSRRLLDKYLNMPYAFFLNRNSADLSNKLLSEVQQLTANYVTPLLTLITRGLVSLFILATLLFVNIWVTMGAVVLLGGTYVIIFWRINRSLDYRGSQQAISAQLRFKAVSEAFGGIKELKVVNRERYFLDTYSNHSLKLAELTSWYQIIAQLPRFALEAVAFGGIILFVLILLLTQQDARQVIPLASLFVFAGYRLIPALSELFHSATTIKFTQAILDRVYNDIVGQISSEAYPGKGPYEAPPVLEPIKFNHKITLLDVSYQYPNTTKNVLAAINIAIRQNSAVAFVGPTGAGKTTLADLVLGLLLPTGGSIMIDDLKLDQSNVRNWQCNLGYVPQHIYLSDDTITRNIAFGLPEAVIDQQAVSEAAKIANIHDFIAEELPDGYETLVGERGIRLSGGQRQRIGIARALYHNPSVIVFDEATSALDGATEDAVLTALQNASKSKTLIIIAHRLTTVVDCDVIHFLDRGIIVDSGSYADLIDRNSKFKKMAKI